MKKTPAISIIVPVYKAETYLCRCLESLLVQTFGDFEILLIDDGSPDRSGEMCDEYAKHDNRIRVFHKKNGGVSSARQMGVDNIQGKYTIQIDPDDWVEPTMLEELHQKAVEEQADIVICDYYVDYGRYFRYVKNVFKSFHHSQVLEDLILSENGFLWNKLIKSICYTEPVDVKLPEDLNCFEDMVICTKILVNPYKIAYVDKAFYHYMQNSNPNSYMRHTKCLFPYRIQLNEIMASLLDAEKYTNSLLYLKKTEAYTALYEKTFSKKEFLIRYVDLKNICMDWYGEKALNKALNGYYHFVVFYLHIVQYIKIAIKKILS